MESGAWHREYELWKDIGEEVEEGEDYDERIIIDEDIYTEVQYVMNWYCRNHSHLTELLERWHEGYVDPEVIGVATITQIYNYLLGIETEYNEKLDLNEDGVINSADITFGYNVILGQ